MSLCGRGVSDSLDSQLSSAACFLFFSRSLHCVQCWLTARRLCFNLHDRTCGNLSQVPERRISSFPLYLNYNHYHRYRTCLWGFFVIYIYSELPLFSLMALWQDHELHGRLCETENWHLNTHLSPTPNSLFGETVCEVQHQLINDGELSNLK